MDSLTLEDEGRWFGEANHAVHRPVGRYACRRLAARASGSGLDGFELACWGDHFDVSAALAETGNGAGSVGSSSIPTGSTAGRWVPILSAKPSAIGSIRRHKAILPPEVWGDGEPEGVRTRAAERLKDTARAAARFGVTVVTGFTGSPIWHLLYSFPPNDFAEIERGYQQFAERFGPIIDVFDTEGVRFALEVHPTEIAYDFVTTRQALAALDNREGFGINFDPSHLVPQMLDPTAFLDEFGPRVYHVHVKDAKRRLDGRRSALGSHLDFGSPDRGWEFVSPGHGDVDLNGIVRQLNRISYDGPLSIEWEDSGMDREYGARDALAFVRRSDFPAAATSFDAAFAQDQD